METSFSQRESRHEASIEFRGPGPSPWRCAQDWAQRAVDRDEGAPLPPYEPVFDPEPPTDHLSYAVGVALARFGASGEGILDPETADLGTALPHGVLYLSAADEHERHDSLAHAASEPIIEAWATHGAAIDPDRTLSEYLRERFFPDVHRSMYENRPIHFPLSSSKKSFVAFVNIHRFTPTTLRDLLAEHLNPEKQRLEGRKADLLAARQSPDKKVAREADRFFTQVSKHLDELNPFIALVEQCAEQGPPPNSCPPRERDARYAMCLDDGVMINAATLWPLLAPQWKDPAKWWTELARAEGKNYDWSQAAARYFPDRVYKACVTDPSVAVAHGCFWKLYPALAYKWQLRLQDEIAPDFQLHEPARTASDAYTPEWVQSERDVYRTRFEADHPDQVKDLIAAEHKRRERKRKKEGDAEPELADTQVDMELDPD